MDNHLKKVALITGASTGIGRAVYEKLIQHGWRVYGTSRQIAKGDVTDDAGGRMIKMTRMTGADECDYRPADADTTP